MLKRDEISSPKSCWNKATDDELIFVLLARDESAVVAVQAWIDDRIRRGKNTAGDPKIKEAKGWVEQAKRKAVQP